MTTETSLDLKRDCDAVQIPSGAPVRLPAGTHVDITQTLGGTYTVHAQGGLYRIAAKDADALGIGAEDSTTPLVKDQGVEGAVEEKQIWETLRGCFDPEIPVNVIDLGLIYDMVVEPLASGHSKVSLKMTLTAPGCGMGATIAGDIQEKLLYLPGVEEAQVEIVWDPPWHHSMISAAGRARLGLE